VSLDALACRWRVALDAEESALATASRHRRSLGFAEEELAERRSRLRWERDATACLLAAVARENLWLH
jgi:hypothetical protein